MEKNIKICQKSRFCINISQVIRGKKVFRHVSNIPIIIFFLLQFLS